MSSKQTSKKSNVNNLDPRIAPKEMIITRHKSAIQKKQLRNKDRSMKAITQLLKGPPKTLSVPTIKPLQKKDKGVAKTPQKQLEKCVTVEMEEKEFYPNTLKRNVVAKKILLKPKYNMRVIAGTNKRKLSTPHRGLKSPPPFKRPNHRLSKIEFEPKKYRQICQSPIRSSPELSMAEVIKMAEETHSLDDDDLMEILTCPSPVWWEDPPNSGFDEDAIFMSSHKPENKEICDKQSANDEQHTDKQININIDNRDCKFKQKRSKLENLLDSIKNKILGCDNVPPITSKDKISPNIDVDKCNISESTEEDMFSDISMNEDDVLKDLESIDIPIEANDKVKSELINVMKTEIEIEIEVPKHMPQLKRCPTKIKDSPKKSDVETLSTEFDSISDTNVRFIEDDEGSKTSDSSPKNNTKAVKRNVKARRKVVKPTPEAPTVTVSQSIDKELVSDLGLHQNTDIEYITVYKIMSNKNDSPIKDDKGGNEQTKQKDVSMKKTKKRSKDHDNKRKLNLFFKKCKSNRRNNRNKTQTVDKSTTSDKESDKNSILVSENNKVKYCYKCSSIFDTDACSYCKRKSKIEQISCLPCKQCFSTDRQCLCDKIKEILTCNICDFKTEIKNVFEEHLLVHNNNREESEAVNNNSEDVCSNPDESANKCVASS